AQNTANFEVVPQVSHSVSSIVFSSDGSHILSGSREPNVKLWDVATGRVLRTFQTNANSVQGVGLSRDGTRALSVDRAVKLWNAATGELVRTLELSSDDLYAAALSPDGARVLTGGNTTLKLWDADTGTLLNTLEDRSAQVRSLAFSTDGNRAVSGGYQA